MAANLVNILNAAWGSSTNRGLTNLIPKTSGISRYSGVPRYTRRKNSSSFVTGNPIDLLEIAGAQYHKSSVGCKFHSEMAAVSGWRAPSNVYVHGVNISTRTSGNNRIITQDGVDVAYVSAYYSGGQTDPYYGNIIKNATLQYYRVTPIRSGRVGHVAGTGGTLTSGTLGRWNVSYLSGYSNGYSSTCHVIVNSNYPS